MPAALTVLEDDPADLICELAGDLDEIEVFNSHVLVGIFQRPKDAKTAGGVWMPQQTTAEDEHQSKVGLILKMGPRAFHDPSGRWFMDQEMSIGDWVVFRPSNGWAVTLVSKDKSGKQRTLLCRLIEDVNVMMRVDGSLGPQRVY